MLGPDRIVWFFGDTILGTVKDGRRADCSMVNNTVAIQKGRGKDAAIHFITGKPKDGKATSFFIPADGKGWFWPQSTCRIGDRLFIFLTQIDKGEGGGVFGFKLIGQWLAIVENPDDEPANWRMTQSNIPFGDFTPGNERSWGSAILPDGEYVYIYGIEERGKAIDRKKLIAARAPAGQFSDFKSWRFRALTGWSESAADAASAGCRAGE